MKDPKAEDGGQLDVNSKSDALRLFSRALPPRLVRRIKSSTVFKQLISKQK